MLKKINKTIRTILWGYDEPDMSKKYNHIGLFGACEGMNKTKIKL